MKKPNMPEMVRKYAADPIVLAAAKRCAVAHSTGFGRHGESVDVMAEVHNALFVREGDWGRAQRVLDAELARAYGAMVELGLLEKQGRRPRLRFVLPRVSLPEPELLAEVVLTEMRAQHRAEASFQRIATFPVLHLLGLEGDRAHDALHLACRHGRLHLSHLMGQERVLDIREAERPAMT